jgi:hypothetical protein
MPLQPGDQQSVETFLLFEQQEYCRTMQGAGIVSGTADPTASSTLPKPEYGLGEFLFVLQTGSGGAASLRVVDGHSP